MSRLRVHASAADRQRAYRLRQGHLKLQVARLREALYAACERGFCSGLLNHLPDEPEAWIPAVIQRLEGRRLVLCRRPRTKKEEDDV